MHDSKRWMNCHLRKRGKPVYPRQRPALVAKETQKEEVTLWHRHLGHLHMAGVKRLDGMAESMAVQKQKEAICIPYIKGKQHKTFNRHKPSARMNRRLEMVHSDNCGPFRSTSQAGANSFVLFRDD